MLNRLASSAQAIPDNVRRLVTIRRLLFGGLLLGLFSVQASAQPTCGPLASGRPPVRILLIHGKKAHQGSEVIYGVTRWDQSTNWAAGCVVHGPYSEVFFVQYDSWNRTFDDVVWPGGYAVVNAAIFKYCATGDNGGGGGPSSGCIIICHSAGCAALENWIASAYATGIVNGVHILHVIAASNAAGGSELANWADHFPYIGSIHGHMDDSLSTTYARTAYDHNAMNGVPIRAIAGTFDNLDWRLAALGAPDFPNQYAPPSGAPGSGNPQCAKLVFTIEGQELYECADGVVPLHSTCGHNRVASFQDCNSTLWPHNDTAGTYAYHSWWLGDGYPSDINGFRSEPYSGLGRRLYNSLFHTFKADHDHAQDIAVEEYSACWIAGFLYYQDIFGGLGGDCW